MAKEFVDARAVVFVEDGDEQESDRNAGYGRTYEELDVFPIL